mmetsp:Transcript_47839/g.121342  ORF Transcript_47839/g.121342 Transcript_47839/m.121342 type:complete len:234 (-) Transcript_47839:444-1145(-)
MPLRPPTSSGTSSGPNSRPIGARVALLDSPTAACAPSGGGTSLCDHMANGKNLVFFPLAFSAFWPNKQNKPTDCSSNFAGSKRVPPLPVRRSRPPDGATHKTWPPSWKRRCISETVFWFLADFTSFSSGLKVSRYFFEKIVSKFLPMLNGMAKRSVVTLWPATKIVFSARSSTPCDSSRRDSTCGSASVWWFARNTTLSPAAKASWMVSKCSTPSTLDCRNFTMDLKKSLPQA